MTGCDFLELNRNKALHILTIMIILLSMIVTATGVFYSTNGKPYDFVNQYGDIVKKLKVVSKFFFYFPIINTEFIFYDKK